jgi:hypothetical protein
MLFTDEFRRSMAMYLIVGGAGVAVIMPASSLFFLGALVLLMLDEDVARKG